VPPQLRPTPADLNLAGLSGKLPDFVIAQIPATAAEFGITTNLRLAHFLAQCALESTGFTATVENLNYSAGRIPQVFPKYFKNVDPAAYAHNPQKLGSRVYANRMGNGDEASGDGFKFRGRGYIQLTGKNNYTSFSTFVGEDCVANPDLVATKYPLASAAFYFNSNKIWAICDKGASDNVVTQVTKAVNGGTHGLAGAAAILQEVFRRSRIEDRGNAACSTHLRVEYLDSVSGKMRTPSGIVSIEILLPPVRMSRAVMP
jgi:putative chitinase